MSFFLLIHDNYFLSIPDCDIPEDSIAVDETPNQFVRIMSPNYPDNYTINSDILWNFHSSTGEIAIEIEDFNASDQCEKLKCQQLT